MSQMLPEGGEVMRRAACGDVCPAPPAPLATTATATNTTRSENKELLRQQLLSASKERLNAEKSEPPKPKHARSRQKNRWKLKFHHQALPQEYLDHYERSLQKASARPPAGKPERAQPEPGAAASPPAPPADRRRSPAVAPSKVVTYDDLPYMGEMTLNDAKPRRGRKPKKADICHLIYENYGTVVPGRPAPAPAPPPAPRSELHSRLLSSLLGRQLARPDAPPPPAPATAPGPLHSDAEPLNLCVRDLRDLKLRVQERFGDIYGPPAPEQANAISVITHTNPGSPSPAPAWWPAAPVCLHPLALLYYQRLAAAAAPPAPPSPSPPAPDAGSKLVLKQISELLEPKVAERGADTPEPKKRASPNPGRGHVKRKRSAIYIPPAPSKTSSAPAAEVSICKFKFTGGSKPTLQEKKMLSVDAGGNFRYYSGTGARGDKGYEYLRQDAARRLEAAPRAPPAAPDTKKRKSRKSLQREKLEQTFKEKGFLIQTQQLQSAEGATYCKFRQLRKFTRYLFRSWKDYLPGELEGEPPPAPPLPPAAPPSPALTPAAPPSPPAAAPAGGWG